MKQVFVRTESLKDAAFHYCPGCGHSIIHRLVAETIDELNIKEKVIGVPPAGCAVLAYNYLDIDINHKTPIEALQQLGQLIEDIQDFEKEVREKQVDG